MSNQNEPQALLTIDELSEQIKVSVSTIYSWRADGYGPPNVKLGKHIRYRQVDVDLWLESQLERA